MLLLEHPPGWLPEREYAFRVLCEELLGLPVATRSAVEGTSSVSITIAGHRGTVSVADGLFGLDETLRLTPASLPVDRPPTVGGVAVPYGRPELTETADAVHIGVDLFGSSFFSLSRYEELVSRKRDAHGRFSSRHAYAVRNGLLARPVVNEWAALLRRALERVWPGLPAVRRTFTVAPTHDVDWAWTPEAGIAARLRAAVGSAVNRDARGAAVRLASLAGGRDAFDTFDWIMDASESRGLRSAFYFIVDGPSPLHACGYSIDDPRIRALVRRCGARGHELGLHGSYTSFRDPDRLAREHERLRAVLAEEDVPAGRRGGRQHFLRWDAEETWSAWDEAGLAYDSSVAYPDATGFRSGSCVDHPAFDHRQRRQLRLREHPLVVMDVALDREQPALDDALRQIGRLKDACRAHDGTFTILWHNSHLNSRRDRRLYLYALDA